MGEIKSVRKYNTNKHKSIKRKFGGASTPSSKKEEGKKANALKQQAAFDDRQLRGTEHIKFKQDLDNAKKQLVAATQALADAKAKPVPQGAAATVITQETADVTASEKAVKDAQLALQNFYKAYGNGPLNSFNRMDDLQKAAVVGSTVLTITGITVFAWNRMSTTQKLNEIKKDAAMFNNLKSSMKNDINFIIKAINVNPYVWDLLDEGKQNLLENTTKFIKLLDQNENIRNHIEEYKDKKRMVNSTTKSGESAKRKKSFFPFQ